MIKAFALVGLLALPGLVSAVITVDPNNLPAKSAAGQSGYNNCEKRGGDSPNAMCQTVWINGPDDWCLFSGPGPKPAPIGQIEEYAVSYCTKPGHGARLIPQGAIKTMHMVTTANFIQITGVGDLTKLLIPKGDDGGEMDPHGAKGTGNPTGGVVIGRDPRAGKNRGKMIQFKEWTNFMSDDEFCIRACFNGKGANKFCEHIYDIEGCYWNVPGKYTEPGFDSCQADPMPPIGVYKNGSSTYTRGVGTQPPPHPLPKTSQCSKVTSLGNKSYPGTTPKPKTTAKTTSKKSTKTTAKPKTTAKTTAKAKPKTTAKAKAKATPKSTPKAKSTKARRAFGDVGDREI